jgi:HlyD family secretion protein
VTAILQAGFVVLTNAVMILLIVVSIGVVQPLLSLAMLALFGASYALVYGLSRRRLLRNGAVQTQCLHERIAVVEQGLGAVKELLLLGGQERFRARFADTCHTISRTAANTQLLGQHPRHVLECVAGGALVAAALWMALHDGRLGADLGRLTFLGFAAYRLLPALQQAFFAGVSIRANRAAFDSVASDLALALRAPARPRRERRADDAWRGRPRSHIVLHDISYRYPRSARLALSRVSLQIAAGSMVGLVGANGSGKSTLADIILGLLEPVSGHVEVDGMTLNAGNLTDWQRELAFVPQQVCVLDATVTENIAFGVPTAQIDPLRVRDAARRAGAHDFIAALPLDYEERLGEHGARLSGGQRQRIGIARALYRGAAVLVLDEASASLDAVAEEALIATLAALRGTCTVIVIAHRLATTRDCDAVFELDAGALVESGAYSKLRAGISA